MMGQSKSQSTENVKNLQPNQLELNIETSHLKCRCCFKKFDDTNEKLLISESHVVVFRNIINVELKLDSSFSFFICRTCDNRLNILSEFVKTFGNIQGKFNDFLDSVTNISEVEIDESEEFIDDDQSETQKTITNTLNMCIKNCYVRLERLDVNSINKIIPLKNASKVKNSRVEKHHKTRSRFSPLIGKLFCCDMCGYQTLRKMCIALHMKARHSVNIIKCEICHGVYDSKLKFNVHFRKIHKERQTFDCLLCGTKSFKYIEYKSLKAHVIKCHSMDKSKITWTCDFCGEIIYSKKRLDNHMNSYHIGAFKCFNKQCQTSFKQCQSRKSHFLFYHNQDLKVRREIVAIEIDILFKSFFLLT